MTHFKKSSFPDNKVQTDICKNFLAEFIEDYTDVNNKKYINQLQAIANKQSKLLEIDLDDIKQYGNVELLSGLLHNTKRYETLFYVSADQLMPRASEAAADAQLEPYDTFLNHRIQRYENAKNANKNMEEDNKDNSLTYQELHSIFPSDLLRRYEIHFNPLSDSKPLKLRDIKAALVGSFVSVRGIVTRVTDVAPQVRVISYICGVCGYESYQPVNDREFTPLKQCPSPACTQNDQAGKLTLQTRGSKFVRAQTVRLQELHTEVPVGHIPRTITIRVYGSLTRTMKPGDLVTVSGAFLVAPYHGFRAVRAGLSTDTYIEAMHVVPQKKSYAELEITPDVLQAIETHSKDPHIYDQLSASIAPEIYGHADIKKALLLLLVSGFTRKLADGLKIRGDINILLMGDPGVAKSQLLKHIAHIAPRGIYTTGKGSSGVGLTAAVLRDPVTGDMSLEGGSLVLADMGICCIDEFDKMLDGDRTAIHEVMEQQTVSIAKAGITTTLNARAAVLAAANPVWGRWRPKATPEQNLGLPASLLSRFDLTWIILDKPDIDSDTSLARHVTYVHINNCHPKSEGVEAFSPAFIRAYVAKARQYQPYVPKELTEFIVNSYVGLRKEGDDSSPAGHNFSLNHNTRQSFCTARSLLSILRLSQALARLRFSDSVDRDDVEEAMRLVSASKQSHLDDSEKKTSDPTSMIYQIIQDMAQERKSPKVPRKDVVQRVVRKGYSEDMLTNTLNQYQDLNVWKYDSKYITFMDGSYLADNMDE